MKPTYPKASLINVLRASLTKAMEAWISAEGDVLSDYGWLGDDAEGLMANAALAVVLAQFDVQAYLHREQLLKPD